MTEPEFQKCFNVALSKAKSGNISDIERALAYIAIKAMDVERFGTEKDKSAVSIKLSNTVKAE